MGCAPSQSGLIRNFTDNLAAGRPGLPPGNKNSLPISLLVESSSFSDLDCNASRDAAAWRKHSLQKKDPKEQGHAPHLRQVYSKDSTELQKDKSSMEQKAPGADSGMAQRTTTESKHLSKQSSSDSDPVYRSKENYECHHKKVRRPRAQKSAKQGRPAKKDREDTSFDAEIKVDFPDLLVQAHQNTYAYLNPNLSKYEAIIGMANQATQTQLIMQQMVSFLSLRFDEINRILEEIADDGEQLLKDVGKNLAWPLEKGDSREQPDLLPQLLQYTVNKMQVLNETVASLTSDVLQDTYSYLESAAASLQVKLKMKQKFDKRLLETMKMLESSIVGAVTSLPNDLTLYSEDSGIGADVESMKEFCSAHKLEKQGSSDSLGLASSGGTTCISSPKEPSKTVTSSDWVLGKHAKDSTESSEVTSSTKGNTSSVPKKYNSPDTKAGKAGDVSESAVDEDDSYLHDNEDNIRLSEILMYTLPPRPMTSPARTGAQRCSTKFMDNPPNEEMTLKMKDAISEKIKFVPVESGSHIWTDDEGAHKNLTRPNTASGCRTHKLTHRRSRSEESLKSQAEDPTLIELQRTQKVLNKRLENMHASNINKGPDGEAKAGDQRERLPAQHSDCMMLSSSMNKLKASLEKHFCILPNQDKLSLGKYLQNGASDSEDKRRKPERPTTLRRESKNRLVNAGSSATNLQSDTASPRQSVRKLIETFTPLENLRPTNARSLGPLKCIKKYGIPVLPPSFPVYRMLEHLNEKRFSSPAEGLADKPFDSPMEDSNQISITTFPPIIPATAYSTDSSEGLVHDLDLPPPPPEILLDTSSGSFECEVPARAIDSFPAETLNQCARKDPEVQRKMTSSEKMKATLGTKDLLPSKHVANMTGNKVVRNNSKPNKYSVELHYTSFSDSDQEVGLVCLRNMEKEEAAQLYKQSHKIIPLQNPGSIVKTNDNGESKEASVSSVQGQRSPISHRKMSPTRRNSPTKSMPSPPAEKRFPSPTPYMHMSPEQTRPPSAQNLPSRATSPGRASPPVQRKLPSPPAQRKPTSPSLVRRSSNPPAHGRAPSPPTTRRDASPPPYCNTPSPPPVSPSLSSRRMRHSFDGSDTSKVGSNAQSIFCPSSPTMFESKQPSPPTSASSEDSVGQYHPSRVSLRNNAAFKQFGEQQRRAALSAANPQPYIRRCYSDRQRRVRFPASVTAGNEPLLNQTRLFCLVQTSLLYVSTPLCIPS
ncbi:photoreceptor cilium actin regulator isoform X2 [Lissotriton helveticus]